MNNEIWNFIATLCLTIGLTCLAVAQVFHVRYAHGAVQAMQEQASSELDECADNMNDLMYQLLCVAVAVFTGEAHGDEDWREVPCPPIGIDKDDCEERLPFPTYPLD